MRFEPCSRRTFEHFTSIRATSAKDDVCVEDGVWRQTMNHELAALYGEPSIQKLAKSGRIRWAGHVAIMSDNNPAKFMFAMNPDGKRSV